MFLVDTNVISEPTKARPNESVLSWLGATPAHDMFLSVLTLGEIQHGIERLAEGKKRQQLAKWHARLETDAFKNRVLPITSAVAIEWAKLEARQGRILARFDALMAATAKVHGLTVVTRNIRHFVYLGVSVINPWTA